ACPAACDHRRPAPVGRALHRGRRRKRSTHQRSRDGDMPGIFGIVPTSGGVGPHTAAERSALLQRMAATMRYDAEYSCDLFGCPELGVSAGRVGLPTSASPARDGHTGSRAADETIVVTAGEPTCEAY